MCQCQLTIFPEQLHHEAENRLLPKAYTILAIERHTELEWNFRVSRDFAVHYGQFVEISLPTVGEAPISVSDFGDGYVDLLIRKVGKVTDALFALDVGDSVWMRGVHGNGYPLESLNGQHLIVVAGGTGVAPVKGLLRRYSEHPEEVKSLDMILGFKNAQAVLYRQEMPLWAKQQNLIVTLDEGEPSEQFQIGRVTDYIDQLDLSDKEDIQVIVVGPPIMIRFVVLAFLARGIAEEHIWVDYERRMACAVGKCGHCRMGETYICVDGPVFRFDQAQHLID
ncbi:MAG: anaerobic sulfite reductase subunit AsrB [Aeromonas sp.]